jgi:hypothetical protein
MFGWICQDWRASGRVSSGPYVVQRPQQHCFLADPLDVLGGPRKPADVVNFAHNVLPRFDLGGQKDHGVATIANSAIGDGIPVSEKLGSVLEQIETEDVSPHPTSTSCRCRLLRV